MGNKRGFVSTFARDELLRRCQEKGLTRTPLEDFTDVVEGLERLAEQKVTK